MEAKRGEIKYYHESGDIWKVKVLNVRKQNYGNTGGREYYLRLLEVVDTNGRNPPKEGTKFSVWKAEDSGGYAGWHLLDR